MIVSDSESQNWELKNLVEAGEWDLLFENAAYQRLSRTGRIVMLRRALENRERELVRAYAGMIARSPSEAKAFHNKKIKPLWDYQDFLDRCMMYYEAGSEHPGKAPPEIQKILE